MRRRIFLVGVISLITFFGMCSAIHAGAVTSKEELVISTTGGGLKVKSDNGNSFSLRGFIQYDFDYYDGAYNAGVTDPGDSGSESEWRRTRITAKGTRGKDWAYDFTIDVDDDAAEASIDSASIRYTGFNNLQLILGRLKVPVSLEQLTSDKWVTTIERSAIYSFGNFLRGKPDFQVGVHGMWDNLSAQLHLIDEGEEDNDESDTYSVAARVANRFLFGNQEEKTHFAHLGASYAVRDFGNEGTDQNFRSRFTVHTIGARPTAGNDVLVEDADQFGLEGAYTYGPISLQGEYLMADFDAADDDLDPDTIEADVESEGYYVLGSYFLTGESRGYKTSNSKFDKPKPKRSIGAWEVFAKYEDGEVDIDDNPNGDGKYDITTLGLNWYPNTNVRFSLNYLMFDSDNLQFGGGGDGFDNPTLDSLGEEDGDAISFRAQYAF